MATLPEFETARLRLRRLELRDARFLVELLNQPSFLEHIGDRGVRTVDDAHRYLREGPLAMYEKHGFGLWHIARISDGAALGLCGLLKRDTLPDVDLGYALLPQFWSRGYALEAAQATLRSAARDYALERVVAIVSPGNTASIRLLEKLGMKFERMVSMRPDEADVSLYACRPGLA